MTRTRVSVGACIVASLVLLTRGSAQDSTQFADLAAADLFRYSRIAISGGGGNVTKLRALIFKGRSRFLVDGGGLAGAAVEIKLLLPDHYLRIDTAGTSQKIAGYAGKTVLSAIHDGANVTYPPVQLRSMILQNERQIVARLLLGATTYVSGEQMMRFSSAPRSVDIIDPRVNPRTSMTMDSSQAEPLAANVSGDHFSARFIVDGKTRLPSKIEFVSADKKTVTMTFGDRRAVDGLQLPFHISTTTEGRVIDDLAFDEILVNPELTKNDFKKE